MNKLSNPYTAMISAYEAGFRQTTEATCGPASMILATMGLGLEIKTESDWRNPEFHPWLPVHDFLSRGMALHELQIASELIFKTKIHIHLRRAYPENLDLFIADLKEAFSTKKQIIILNYRQDDFATTTPCSLGNPHYSPAVDFNMKKSEILIADTDFLIPKPYWVSIKAIFTSMSNTNLALGIPRGWLVVKKR